MALNFPIPTSVGQVYQDPTSGNTYVCTSLGPPAQWVGSGSSTSLDETYLRKDASNDPVTGQLTLDSLGNSGSLLIKQPIGNKSSSIRITNSGFSNSIETDGGFAVSVNGSIELKNLTFNAISPGKTITELGKNLFSSLTKQEAKSTVQLSTFVEVADKWNDGSQVTNWERFSTDLQTIVSKNRDRGLTSGAASAPVGSFYGSGAFIGGVLLLDGRVFCVPYLSTTALIFDPSTNVTSAAGGSYAGGAAFGRGVLLRDGRVFLVPYYSTTARIYNPLNDSLIVPGGTYPGGGALYSGVLLLDGRVFCVPAQSSTARIYDPFTDTVTIPSGAYSPVDFSGAVLLPDGRVFLVPHSSTSAKIYDPATDVLSTASGVYPGGGAFAGGVLMSDGRVFCVPYNSTTARIYDPFNDVVTIPSGIYPIGSGLAFQEGVLTPDGRVFCAPDRSLKAILYDPFTDSLSIPGGSYPGTAAFHGAVGLKDGRIFLVPHNNTTSTVVATKSHIPLDCNVYLSPFITNY